MSFLSLQGLEKTYADGTHAVRGINLDVEEGEFVVLLGPSGCGKTSTLRMLAGLELATAGKLLLRGQDVTSLKPAQRDIGMVFQFYALYPHLTVEKNLRFPLDAQGMSRADQNTILQAVIQRLGIEPLLKRYPRQLSGGDQQRVALGRALVRRPSLFLMDEPLGTLDADQRLLMREFIREQQQALGVTTIYVTHDQEEAMSLADRVVVMSAGRICQNDQAMTVYENPADTFVADFVGSPGMNLCRGTFDTESGKFIADDSSFLLDISADRFTHPVTSMSSVQVGIRAEYLYLDARSAIRARVLLCEYMGHCQYAHVQLGRFRMVIRLAANDRLALDQEYGVAFDPQHIQVFDVDSGNRL